MPSPRQRPPRALLAPPREGDSSVTVATQMFGADFLKLRRKRGILIWALVLALAPIVIFFMVMAIQHASNPAKYEPAGGASNFGDGLRVLALFFGPLAAILIGVEAGTSDASAGVFRDLVVTGRSRLALFASRVPAALALCWADRARSLCRCCSRAASCSPRTCPRPDGARPQRPRLRAARHRRAVRDLGRSRVADRPPSPARSSR